MEHLQAGVAVAALSLNAVGVLDDSVMLTEGWDATCAPVTEALRSYPVKVDGQRVYLQID
ncbi:MAG: hypothetical protein WCD45_09805 [Gallionella sp.]